MIGYIPTMTIMMSAGRRNGSMGSMDLDELLSEERNQRVGVEVDEATDWTRATHREERERKTIRKSGVRSFFSWLIGSPKIKEEKAESSQMSMGKIREEEPTECRSDLPIMLTITQPGAFRTPRSLSRAVDEDGSDRKNSRSSRRSRSEYESWDVPTTSPPPCLTPWPHDTLYDARSNSRTPLESAAFSPPIDFASSNQEDRTRDSVKHSCNAPQDAATTNGEESAYALMRSLDCEFEHGRETQNMFHSVMDHFLSENDAPRTGRSGGQTFDFDIKNQKSGWNENEFGRFSVRPTPSSPRTRGEYDDMLSIFLQKEH